MASLSEATLIPLKQDDATADNDLTVIYYTANIISDHFADNSRSLLLEAIGDLPIIAVSHKPVDFGYNSQNIVVKMPRHQASIYRQALIGARAATTRYIAMAEDDVFYSYAHFQFRPNPGHWGYNMNSWSMFTWGVPLFHYKAPGGRRNLNGLICERQMFIDHLEERFKLWPDDSKIDIRIFGEPGKYDNQLGTTPHPSEFFYPNPPNIVFSHEENLQFAGLGKRKGLGQIRATRIPHWGEAENILKLARE